MTKIYTMVAAFLLGGGMAMAQTDNMGRVSVKQAVEKTDGKILVRMEIVLDSVEMKSQHSLVLTPVLLSKDKSVQKELAPVVVNGRVRQKAYQRDVALKKASDNVYGVVRRDNGGAQSLSYEAALPYERWMAGGYLTLREELTGCAACELNHYERTLGRVLPQATVAPVLASVYVAPPEETVKRRQEYCELNLQYIVGRSDVVPSQGRNREELAKLQDLSACVETNADFTVTGYAIESYASPDGGQAMNMRLSEQRAKRLAQYLTDKHGWNTDRMKISWYGEDWKGLVEALKASSLKHKDKVLAIVDEEKNFDARDAKIRAIDGGATYATLLKDFYPQLRRSMCTINFIVRAYSKEEAKNVYRENPKLLSLKEMYEVANEYPKTSETYKEVLFTAQRLHPESEAAVVNAATILLEQGKAAEARAMLQHIGQTAAVNNALGLACAIEKNFAKAVQYFELAEKQGCAEAKSNRKVLEEFLEEWKQNNNY